MRPRFRQTLAIFISAFILLTAGTLPAQKAASRPNAEARQHIARAQQALAAKQLELAAQELQAALKSDPRNVEAHANLGVVQFLQGNYPEASANLREALRLQPQLWKAQAILGLCEKAQRKPEPARALLEKSVPHLQDPQLQVRAGMTLVELDYQQREYDKALSVLQILQKTDPTNADVLYVTYRIHSDLASQARDNLALVAPKSARMHQLLAQHLVNEGKIKAAIEQYREALKIDPRLPSAHFELGEAILEDSPLDEGQQEAQREFEAAVAVNPSDAKAECRLGVLANVRNDTDAARQHYERAAELAPGDSEAQVGLGRLLMSDGHPDQALPYFQRAVELDPLNSRAHYRLSQAYSKLGQTADAEKEIKIFNDLRATEDRLHAAYAQIYRDSGLTRFLNPDVPQ